MSATDSTTADTTSQGSEPEVFWDTLFRDSKGRVVEPPVFPSGVRFADTHTHLDMLEQPGLALARCAAHGVDFLVTVIDPTENERNTFDNLDVWLEDARILLADWGFDRPLPEVRVIIGCHPHNASKYDDVIAAAIINATHGPLTVGIGEIGLDYHYDYSPRDVQQQVFRQQLRLAQELELPVSLHLREAHYDGLRILKEAGLPAAGTLLHCFNLDYATLEPFLKLGCQVAFGGPITFTKTYEVREAAARTPVECIMTETDAPFMAPVPLRGTECGPEDVVFSAAKLADIAMTVAIRDGKAWGEKAAAAFYAQLHRSAEEFFKRPFGR